MHRICIVYVTQGVPTIKTATLPSLRVDPERRLAAENVLQAGETLSSFVEQAVRNNVVRRQAQQAFIARGLAGRNEARSTGEYFSSDSVLQGLDEMFAQAESRFDSR